MATTATTQNRPVETFRLKGLSASVFKNSLKKDGQFSAFYKVTLQKTYKEGKEFRTTTSLGRDDLPIAGLLLRRAWEFILDEESPPPQEAMDD
jgi:hypothetical protein